jgi:alpha-tubulin suppressor-like RCC1 family protein
MVKRYYGGMMTANLALATGASASGFYSTHQQMQATRAGAWPIPADRLSFFTPPYFAWGWGNNLYGQLGVNDLVHRSSPIILFGGSNAWQSIAIADNHAVALGFNGSLWTMGNNAYGQLGDNTVINKSSPVQTVAAGSNWSKIAVGQRSTAAIKNDGTLWLWGKNNQGQLGDNIGASVSSPVQTVAGGTNWSSVTGDALAYSAIKTDGTLWTWGQNNAYQLGDGTIINRASPVQTIIGGTDWAQVDVGRFHTIALKTDNTFWGWGHNNYSQAGQNQNIVGTRVTSPMQLYTGGSWSKISAGGYSSVGIKTDGTLWTWGRNLGSELGVGDGIQRSSPVQTVSGGSNWYTVAMGAQVVGAIKTDGTLWTWGAGDNGVMGDNTTIGKNSPVQTVAGGTNWRQVYASGSGNNFTSANAAIVALRTA